MNIHISHQRHSVNPSHERRPGEGKVRQKVEQKLQTCLKDDMMCRHWTETLIAMWEEAIDLGCSTETAQEKLDESLRSVIHFHGRIDLSILQRRKMIQNVLDQMSREIKTDAHRADEALPVPTSREERRAAEKQKQRDDDPLSQLREKNQEGARERDRWSHRVNTANHLPPHIQRRK